MQIVYRHPPSTGLYCVIGRGPLRPFLASVSPADLPSSTSTAHACESNEVHPTLLFDHTDRFVAAPLTGVSIKPTRVAAHLK